MITDSQSEIISLFVDKIQANNVSLEKLAIYSNQVS